MQIGDTVRWTSQAGGFSKTKTGVIIEAVRPFSAPSQQYGLRATAKRSSTSYVVKVGNKYYWPYRSLLKTM